MLNTIQTKEDENQISSWIEASQKEAITETNNTKKIVKDFEETENKITDLEDKKEQIIKAQKLLQENYINTEQYEVIIKNIDIHKIAFRKWIKETENNREERIKTIENFKQLRKLLDENIAAIPETIIEYFDNNSQATIQDAINTHFDKIKNLDGAIQIQIIEKVITYKKKIDNIEKYMNKYKSAPAQLLCEMRGIKSETLSNPEDIKMERLWSNLVFHVNNELDFMKILGIDIDDTNGVLFWFFALYSKIPELEWTLSVLNTKKASQWDKEWSMIHENRHNINREIFRDKERTPYLRAQDEILAYLKEWVNPDKIYTSSMWIKWWQYDYHEETLNEKKKEILKKYKEWHINKKTAEKYIKKEEKKYQEIWNNYSNFLKKSLQIAEKFKVSRIDNYIDLLSITPIEQRAKLESRYKDKLILPRINTLKIKIINTKEDISNAKRHIDYFEKKWEEDQVALYKDMFLEYEEKKKMYEEMLEEEKTKLNYTRIN